MSDPTAATVEGLDGLASTLETRPTQGLAEYVPDSPDESDERRNGDRLRHHESGDVGQRLTERGRRRRKINRCGCNSLIMMN